MAAKDELSDECPFTPFIGFVFADEAFRGRRISEKLIQAATVYAAALGHEKIYVMSGEEGLYEKYGFEKLGEYPTIYQTTEQLFCRSTAW